MKKILVIILCCCFVKINAQHNKNPTAKLLFSMPMNNVDSVNYFDEEKFKQGCFPQKRVTFISKDSTVFSVSEGTVESVALIEDMYIIIISTKANLFFTYVNLGTVFVKKGDKINLNQMIGYAIKDLDGIGPLVYLYLNTQQDQVILNKRNFVPRKDKL